MVTLRQLRYAAALAETGHFGHAAAQVSVSQPALSQQIRHLEETCGTPLFDRLTKRVTLTPFGREFVQRARQVIAAADALEAFAGSGRGHPDRPLRFGLIPTVAPYLLPDVFPALRRQFPDLAFALSESKTDALLHGLEQGSLDLALIASAPPAGGPQVAVEPLAFDRFVLATAPDQPGEGPVDLADLDPERMLLLDEGHCFRDQALAACALRADAGSRAFAATSLATVVEFVANGQGVTLLPEIALRKEAVGDRVKVRPLTGGAAGRTLSLVWREAAPFAETFMQIAGVVRATLVGGRDEEQAQPQ